MAKKKAEKLLLGKLFTKIAPKLGAKILMEPEWNIVGQISFKNGRKRYFRYNSLDLNPLGSSEISKDKGFANFFMANMGYKIVPGRTIFSQRWAKAIGSRKNTHYGYNYARRLGFPVIVKPNSGSQGVGVCKVYNQREFYSACKFIFERDKVALVQPALSGRDYRLVVLDKQVISAYERIPLNIIGDGRSSISKLLEQKQKLFERQGRDTQIKTGDFRILRKLKRQGLAMRSVPKNNQQVFLLDNANLSGGGDSVDVTDSVHPAFRRLAVRLTADMGLRLCGVDLFIADGDISSVPNKYWILETNAAPGLDHYVLAGKKQEKIVEDMYTEVLKAMK